MTHFETDVRFPGHRKVRALGKDRAAGAGVWLLAGCWSRLHNNTGFVPTDVVAKECGDPKLRIAGRLVEVELWIEDDEKGEQGYRFNDWSDWRPSDALEAEAEEAARRRASDAERKRRQRDRDRDDDLVSTNGHVTSHVTGHADSHVTGHVTPPLSSPPHPPISHPGVPFGDTAYAATTRAPAREAHPREAQPSDLAERCVREFTPRGVGRRDLRKLAVSVDEAHADGASWPAIQQALVAWSRRSDCTPGLLPSLITEAVKAEHGATTGRPEHEQAPRETHGDATIRRLRGMKSGDSEPLRALPGGPA